MFKLPIDIVQIGSRLAESVVVDGDVLFERGTPISVAIKETLLNYNIREVFVVSKLDNIIPDGAVAFNTLNADILHNLQCVSVDNILAYVSLLVNGVLKNDCRTLLHTLYAYDEVTYQHSINVANLACAIGVQLGLNKTKLKELTIGALLHDIGKLKTPLEILQKKGKLSPVEYSVIQGHTLNGPWLVKGTEYDTTNVTDIIQYHHENYDGTGYPYGLSNVHIPHMAMVVHVCDVYEAMCAERSYKKAMRRDKARHEIELLSGKMFNPNLLDAFFSSIPAYILGEVLHANGHDGIIVDNRSDSYTTILTDHRYMSVYDFYKLPIIGENYKNEKAI